MRASNGEILLISRAEENDFQEIYDLKCLTVQNIKEPALINKKIEEALKECKENIFLKATDERDRIAGVVGSYSDNGTLYITEIFVHPDCQNQGIETKLLEEIERLYSCSNFKLCIETENESVLRFFENCGNENFDVQNNIVFFIKSR